MRRVVDIEYKGYTLQVDGEYIESDHSVGLNSTYELENIYVVDTVVIDKRVRDIKIEITDLLEDEFDEIAIESIIKIEKSLRCA